MHGGEVEEGRGAFAVLDQAVDRLGMFRLTLTAASAKAWLGAR